MASLSSQVAALTSPQKSKFVSLFVSNVSKLISLGGPMASVPVNAAASTIRSNPMLAPAAVSTVEAIPFLPGEVKTFIQGLISKAKSSTPAPKSAGVPQTKTPITEKPAASVVATGGGVPWKTIGVVGAVGVLGLLLLKRKKG